MVVNWLNGTEHRSSDPDESKAIAGLAPGAAAAYDHLDAELMKQKLDERKS